MKITKDLNPPELDYWVAKAEGLKPEYIFSGRKEAKNRAFVLAVDPEGKLTHGKIRYQPSANWFQSGPIIERGEIRISCADDKRWWAERRMGLDGKQGFCTSFDKAFVEIGPTPLIAAMRAYVSSKFGEKVDEEY